MKFVFCAIIATIFGVANANLDDFDKRCIRACTDIYAPVCGHDGEHFRIFPSECVMESENCNLLFKSQKAFTKTSMRSCQQSLNQEPEEEDEDNNDEFCPKMCPFLWKPVCAIDGDLTKVFPNSCELKKSQCRFNTAWKQTEMEVCNSKKIASDLEDYSVKQECLKACTLNYDPICGFDGEKYYTFGNKCDMEVQMCLMGERKWTILGKGEC